VQLVQHDKTAPAVQAQRTFVLREDLELELFDAVGRDTAMAWLRETMVSISHLPLQVTPACLAASPASLQCWQAGRAQLVFSVAEPAAIRIHSLVDRDPGQRDALALLKALSCRFTGHAVTVPQLQRLDVGGQALRDLGFEVLPLHQCLMLKPLV
jgi:hypothetical protein